MGPQKIEHYTHPDQFLPLMPGGHRMGPLLERASDLTRAAARLALPAGQVPKRQLGDLLRRMNSYYTNRLEGEHTRPSDIEKALRGDESRDADIARKQRLAVAHINAEQDCELHADEVGLETSQLYSGVVIKWIHSELFARVDAPDQMLVDGSFMALGEYRQRQVAVGRHEAPLHSAIPAFMDRWSSVYGKVRRGEEAIVAAAAAHHRLAWIHPFPDGNGRVARLHTHLVLRAAGLTHGLWSPLRGFARTDQRYKLLLAEADAHRQGDLDGRGNLTERGLVAWIAYCLDVFIDQAEFMARQLDVGQMRERILQALTVEESTKGSGVRKEALIPLHYLFAAAPTLTRAEFKTMTGLGDRTATALLSALLARGFLASDSPYGAVRFAIPDHALRFYFPALWPEAVAEQDREDRPRRALS